MRAQYCPWGRMTSAYVSSPDGQSCSRDHFNTSRRGGAGRPKGGARLHNKLKAAPEGRGGTGRPKGGARLHNKLAIPSEPEGQTASLHSCQTSNSPSALRASGSFQRGARRAGRRAMPEGRRAPPQQTLSGRRATPEGRRAPPFHLAFWSIFKLIGFSYPRRGCRCGGSSRRTGGAAGGGRAADTAACRACASWCAWGVWKAEDIIAR